MQLFPPNYRKLTLGLKDITTVSPLFQYPKTILTLWTVADVTFEIRIQEVPSLAVLTEDYRGLSQFLRPNSRTVPRLGHRFISDLSHFIILPFDACVVSC